MAGVQSLSAAQVVVLAAKLCEAADYAGLRSLQSQRVDILGVHLCCRILLTFTSENEQPICYVPVLKQLWGSADINPSRDAVDISDVERLSDQAARRRVTLMSLEQLKAHCNSSDDVIEFLTQQAYRIDVEIGDLAAICQLVEPFIGESASLQQWLKSCHIQHEEREADTFKAMLAAKEYGVAIEVYLEGAGTSPLPAAVVEKLVEREILEAYDNASNGNKERGGMKRASEILKAFGPHFPPSSPVNKVENLLDATHALSFYHLTLQHGVPFQPVSIRVHQDPISLISRVLGQNPEAYTKLDDLLSIGRAIVAAELPALSAKDKETPSSSSPTPSVESEMLEAERRIVYDAINSALSSNDFDTAYSYILTRLNPSSRTSQSSSTSDSVDDLSWRAAYAAGCHRATTSSGTFDRSDQIISLGKRLDLLSLSITLVPDAAKLPFMLATWQRCEAQLNDLRARDEADERAWDDRGDDTTFVPGGFGLESREGDVAETRRARDRRKAAASGRKKYKREEAPMGLFEVARDAATAIGKTAFPLKSTGGEPSATVRNSIGDTQISRSPEHTIDVLSAETAEDGHERLRKRDVVSNMVTGGLVSGLGWVLGAQPVQRSSAATSHGDVADI